MLKILPKDLAYALKIYGEWAIICSDAPRCFFGRPRPTECPRNLKLYFYQSYLGRYKMIWNFEGFEKITKEMLECPLLKIRQELEEETPLFYQRFKEFCESLGGEDLKTQALKREFLSVMLFGILAIFSANRQIPYISKEIFYKIERAREERGKRFWQEIDQELRNLNPEWYRILVKKLKAFDFDRYSTRAIKRMLKVLVEAIKKIPPLDKGEVMREVERILREAKK